MVDSKRKGKTSPTALLRRKFSGLGWRSASADGGICDLRSTSGIGQPVERLGHSWMRRMYCVNSTTPRHRQLVVVHGQRRTGQPLGVPFVATSGWCGSGSGSFMGAACVIAAMPRSRILSGWQMRSGGRWPRSTSRAKLPKALSPCLDAEGAYLVDVRVAQQPNCYPMVPAGRGHQVMLHGGEVPRRVGQSRISARTIQRRNCGEAASNLA